MHWLEKKDIESIWHPFTPMEDWAQHIPLVIASGSGVILKDIYGHRYIDGVSSLWTNVHGHKKRKIDNAIRRQLRKMAHSTLLGLSHPQVIILTEKLRKILPSNLCKIFYSDNGSTAIEAAVKIAYQYWQQKHGDHAKKKKFITLTHGYHGDTLGSVSLGGIELFHERYRDLLFETLPVPAPHCYRCPCDDTFPSCHLRCIELMRYCLETHAEEVAGIVMEPLVQGAAGILTHPKGYLAAVNRLCHDYHVLHIVDEVATGFGRTGTMFACEQEAVCPDIMTLAKGITGGYLPLAATCVTQEIYAQFLGNPQENRTFFHGHTYTGNPLACAAAIANIQIFSEEKTLNHVAQMIAIFTELLQSFTSLPHVGQIRQCGLMVGIECVKNPQTREPYLPQDRIGHQIILSVREHGVILRSLGDVIVLMPPLSISEKELRKLCQATYHAIESITET